MNKNELPPPQTTRDSRRLSATRHSRTISRIVTILKKHTGLININYIYPKLTVSK